MKWGRSVARWLAPLLLLAALGCALTSLDAHPAAGGAPARHALSTAPVAGGDNQHPTQSDPAAVPADAPHAAGCEEHPATWPAPSPQADTPPAPAPGQDTAHRDAEHPPAATHALAPPGSGLLLARTSVQRT